MRQVIAELERIRQRSRALLLAQRGSVIAAWILGLALALIGIDYVLRLPSIARAVLLAGGLGALAWALWTYMRPAVRFRPQLTDLALRAEGMIPAVAGRLASSVEFAASGIDKTNKLAARSVSETERRLAGEPLSRVLTGDRTWRSVGALLGVLAIVATAAVVNPAAARTGAARLLAPFGAAEWPARTGVESLMADVVPDTWVHPRGQALPLRARVTKGQPDYVEARYRLRDGRRWGQWNRIVLTDQGGGIHERLVDTTADAIEYYFETWDASTRRESITLAAPPAVIRAALTVTPPSYAAEWFSPLEADLGPGLDARAVTETPSLVGSQVELVLELNKALPAPQDEPALRAELGWEAATPPPALTVDPDFPNVWTLSWRLRDTCELDLELIDEYGLPNTEAIAYRIDAVDDRLPSVTIMEPESDEPVLPTAVVPLVAEARDDVAVSTLGLEAVLDRGEQTPSDAAMLWQSAEPVYESTGRLRAELNLAEHELSEGDTVLVRGVAGDVFELDGLRHADVRSPARRLRIISEVELARRLRREMIVVRQNAIRIEARQAELEDDVIEDGMQPGQERAQAQIGERIAQQREALDRVAERMQMNRLEDDQLGSLVQQAGDMLDFAGRAANRAVEAIERRQDEQRAAAPQEQAGRGDRGADRERRADAGADADARRGDREPDGLAELDAELEDLIREPAEADREIVEAQREVRQELTDLITLLDRDEDTWVATRRLEELMERQAALEGETGMVGDRTLGRDWDELTAGEQSDLERMAQTQSDLAEQARQLIEDLRRRADELEQVDPQGASSMRQAADSGEQRELNRDMESAAERLGRNQMRTAQADQQGARQTLQEMLRDMRESSRANAEELLRRLASLIESIERLITVQQNELTALERAIEAEDFSGRDRGMIRLAQNTQTVAAEARAAGQESRRVARLLDRAADAQGAAVLALRTTPLEAEQAEEAEHRSLELLREARALAEELEQTVEQRELMRQRGELVDAYRELAEREIALRGRTLELDEQGPLDRRGLIEARGLGRTQEEIRTALDDLRVTTPEVLDSPTFSHVHQRMDDWARDVSESLVGGDLARSVTDRQQRIADSIGRLIEALEDLIVPPEKFAGNQGGGGGGGGGQPAPLIPPLAELMVLRGMQEQVYDQTRALDDRRDLELGERRARLAELGEDQRQLRELGERMAEALQGGPRGPSPEVVPEEPGTGPREPEE